MKNSIIEDLKTATGLEENKCIIINDILNNHCLIGHNNKDKIKADFVEKLEMTNEEADKLYNKCAEIIVKGIFRKQ